MPKITEYKFNKETQRVFVSADKVDADRLYLMRDLQLPCKFEMDPKSRKIVVFDGYLNESGSKYSIARNLVPDITIKEYLKLIMEG